MKIIMISKKRDFKKVLWLSFVKNNKKVKILLKSIILKSNIQRVDNIAARNI